MNQQFAIVEFAAAVRRASPLIWRSSILMIAAMFICMALSQIDMRMIAGISVWEKPAKFFLAMTVQAVSIGWGLSLLKNQARGVKIAAAIYVIAGWLEISYIIFRASRGEASHFNDSSIFAIVMYALMGLGAVSMTGSSAYVGWRLWQQRGGSLMREATAIGLMLGAVLGTIAGGYLSQQHGHWIGGDMTDATGLPFFHWSTTGGDLRVAHFVGLHTAQVLPLAALSQSRWVVTVAALAGILLMAATFGMAVMGVPLFAA